MRFRLFSCFCLLFLHQVLFAQMPEGGGPGQPPVSVTDAFDVSTGVRVVDATAMYAGYAVAPAPENMLGGYNDCQEHQNTVFNDQQTPPDDTDYVEFVTPNYVALSGYRLVLGSDVGRQVDLFTLRADLDGNGQSLTLVDQFAPGLTPAGQLYVDTVDTNRTLATPRLARRWKAEFKRHQLTKDAYGDLRGPRVVELDAITPTNGAPVSVSLTSPGEGAEYLQGQPVPMKAAASSADGIFAVEYMINGERVGESRNSPDFSFEWSGNRTGTLNLQARATSMKGLVAFSEFRSVTIKPLVPRISSILVNGSAADIVAENLSPSADYSLQRSTDLMNWTDALSFTAYDSKATLSDQPDAHTFYRIKRF